MSRKTMAEFPDLYNIWRPPRTTHPQNDDTRAQDLIDGKLDGDKAVRAYRVNWTADTHLGDASENFRDSLWGINEGKRDVSKPQT